MIIDIIINAIPIFGCLIIAIGLYRAGKSFLFWMRTRKDRAPLVQALQRMEANVKARNKRMSVERIEDTFP